MQKSGVAADVGPPRLSHPALISHAWQTPERTDVSCSGEAPLQRIRVFLRGLQSQNRAACAGRGTNCPSCSLLPAAPVPLARRGTIRLESPGCESLGYTGVIRRIRDLSLFGVLDLKFKKMQELHKNKPKVKSDCSF